MRLAVGLLVSARAGADAGATSGRRWRRRIAFFAGLAAIYVVLETRFEYLAEHQFFFNRIQHVTMHHLGPFLLALAWPGETLSARRAALGQTHRARIRSCRRTLGVLQQPILAGVLFAG